MEIGTDQLPAPYALEAVAAIVAEAGDDAAEWLFAFSQIRAAAVVLEAGQALAPLAEVDLDHHVADQAGAGLAYRLEVDHAESRSDSDSERA